MPQTLEMPTEGGSFERLPDGTLVRLSEKLKPAKPLLHEAHEAALAEMSIGTPEPDAEAPSAADGLLQRPQETPVENTPGEEDAG